ncbi:TatD family hydrolase [Streptomyces demainii]|uniref:TatD DNase family protein n=1 Tax=Streptomyces demainii TaxID=588122 RepID=A0ABT9KWQ8_9ACTN|nr:TatD family hydrolase [Streptomyces demainii]MDP9612863.1 TatD DNase family protein [Streptomyces demainii]
MTTDLPPIDLHAHVETGIAAADLTALKAVVFAPTRTLDAARTALARTDSWTVWGVGVHPGLVKAHKGFSQEQFTHLCDRTPYVSEIGLGGKSRVTPSTQQATFTSILEVLQRSPRITSIHSCAATEAVVRHLTNQPIHGAVLHWWLGSDEETDRAIDLGCYFSVNPAMARRTDLLRRLPLDRVLPETDHPFGDRSCGPTRRPGNVVDIEQALSTLHGLSPARLRRQTWHNLSELVRLTRTRMLLPRPVRVSLTALPPTD